MKAEIKNKGNWNMKYKDALPVYSKPIAEIDGKCWRHEDILTLIETYHIADFKAIQMILDPKCNTGKVKIIDEPFLFKVINLVNKLKKDFDKYK